MCNLVAVLPAAIKHIHCVVDQINQPLVVLYPDTGKRSNFGYKVHGANAQN